MKKLIFASPFAAICAVALTSCDQAAPGLSPSGGGSASTVVSTGNSAPPPATPPAVPAVAANAAPKEAVKPVEAPKPQPTPVAVTEAPKPAPPPAGATKRIQPDFPPPLFAGTPLPANNDIPNLDKSAKPTTFADLPEGVQLLSKGAPVTSSDSNPFTGELKCVTDGEKDGSDGFYVELAPAAQWVQIDLGAEKEIWAVWVWHFHKQAVIYKGVVVQVSNDPEFKNATTIFNNDFDNSVQLGVGKDQSYVETNHGRFVPANGVKGRYVRLYSNGRYIDEMNHYIEVEVYGK